MGHHRGAIEHCARAVFVQLEGEVLVTIHPIQPAPRAVFSGGVGELRLVPFAHLEWFRDLVSPNLSHTAIAVIFPLPAPSADSVMLAFDKVKIPTNGC